MKSSEITAQVMEAPSGVIFMGVQSQNEKEELKRIELAARTCYKSEDKITEESSVKMFETLTSRQHYAMLRFGERTFNIPFNIWQCFYNILSKTNQLQFWRRQRNNTLYNEQYITVTSNLQSWLFLFKAIDYDCVSGITGYGRSGDILIHPVELQSFIMKIFRYWPIMTKLLRQYWTHKEDIERCEYEGNEIYTDDIPFELLRFTFRVATDRGITHEIVRHTTLSYAQESTRYVNYNGQNPFMWIPPYLKDNLETTESDNNKIEAFQETLDYCYEQYKNAISNGTSPGEARNHLPHCLKTEICISGYYDKSEYGKEFNQGFAHFVRMRKDKSAHRGIQPIAQEIEKTINKYIGE